MRRVALGLVAVLSASCAGTGHSCQARHDGSRLRFDGVYVAGGPNFEGYGRFYLYMRFHPDGRVYLMNASAMEPASARRWLRPSNATRRTPRPIYFGCYRLEENRFEARFREPLLRTLVHFAGIVAGNFVDVYEQRPQATARTRHVFRWLSEDAPRLPE